MNEKENNQLVNDIKMTLGNLLYENIVLRNVVNQKENEKADKPK